MKIIYSMFTCLIRLEEFYSYTEKIQQKRTRKTKQNKGKLCTANNYIYTITILTLNKSIQAVQLIYSCVKQPKQLIGHL